MLHLLLLISLGFFLQLAEAQSFTVPSKWRKPTTTLSRQDRLTLVNGLLDTVHPALNTTTGMFQGLSVPQTANMLCALSIGDRISNSTSSKDVVLQSLNTTFGRAPNIVTLRSPQLNSDAAVWGLAAIYSYKAYNDQSSLRFAQSMWAQVNRYMVTTDDATAGSHPEKTAAFPSTCNGASNAGAVFYIANNVNNTVVNSETVGTFLALSAHLYEQTQNVQYLSAAELSASFVTTVLYDGNAIRDGITLGTCDTVNDFWTSNSGVVIEGLSILASTHSTYTSRLNSLISATIPYSRWTNVSDGIIIEGPTSAADANSNGATFGYKAILVRGLYEAYSRIPSNSSEASFIQSFITVQLNALTDLSSVTGSNLYSPKWEGPPPTQLLPWGQLAAVDVLNAAVGLAEDASNTMSLSPTPTSNPQRHLSKSSTGISPGAIGGIVAGVIVLLSLLGILLFVVIRKRRQRRWDEKSSAWENTRTEPYPTLLAGNSDEREFQNTSQGVLLPGGDGSVDATTVTTTSTSAWGSKRRLDILPKPTSPTTPMPTSTSTSRSIAGSSEMPAVAEPTSRSIPSEESEAGVSTHSDSETPFMVDLTSFRALVERLNGLVVSHPSGVRVEGEGEEPPPYIG